MTTNPAADLTATAKPIFSAQPTALDFQPERYIGELDELDLSAEQKTALLTALWQIMRSFVELGVSSDLSRSVLQGAGLLSPSASDRDGDE